ncbi:MAG TPA: TA system VapC family ribonuclease toxin [Thermoanaerobaculia bacterium]|nr:TA system VapC family ribonuclease toxin [Thermoanaerobaculia bacterium]
MILLDANLLLYAKFSDLPQHDVTHKWLQERLSGSSRIGIPWHSSVAFLRISTNPRIFSTPLGIREAWKQMAEWLDHPLVWIPEPTQDHQTVLARILQETQATANLVSDAHLAAIAIEHGLTLCSADSDFARFSELSWLNPLKPT